MVDRCLQGGAISAVDVKSKERTYAGADQEFKVKGGTNVNCFQIKSKFYFIFSIHC